MIAKKNQRFNYGGFKISSNLCSVKVCGDSRHFWVGEANELLSLDDLVELYISINPDTQLEEHEILESLEIFYNEG